MTSWPQPATSIPDTETLLRRVGNPTFEEDSAIAQAVAQLVENLQDFGSERGIEKILRALRRRVLAGDKFALQRILAAFRKAMGNPNSRGAVFTHFAQQAMPELKKPARVSTVEVATRDRPEPNETR
jgi:hypothetical protein